MHTKFRYTVTYKDGKSRNFTSVLPPHRFVKRRPQSSVTYYHYFFCCDRLHAASVKKYVVRDSRYAFGIKFVNVKGVA